MKFRVSDLSTCPTLTLLLLLFLPPLSLNMWSNLYAKSIPSEQVIYSKCSVLYDSPSGLEDAMQMQFGT